MKSIKVPSLLFKKDKLPEELKTDHLKIIYRCDHPKIQYTKPGFSPEDIELELPDSYLEALIYFIAARIHAPVGMTTEERLNNIWHMKYEQECQKLEMFNIRIDDVGLNHRLVKGGWV